MLAQLLDQARRRVVAQLALDKGALAVTIGMGGLILLLLTGTQIFDWYWPVLLIVGSLGVGLYQLRKYIPSRYTLAQRIDHRANLADALSTAVYFGEHPLEGADAVCRLQHREAEALAAGVNLGSALPFQRSRYLAPAAGLLMVAAGLFAVRYAVTGSLDLQPSLIGMAIDTFFDTPAEELPKPPLRADSRPQFFDPSNPDAPPPLDELTEMPVESNESSDLSKGDSGDDTKAQDKGDLSDQSKEGENQEPADDQKGRDPNPKQSDKQDEGKEGGEDSPQENRQESSMLDKLRDAVSNLMNKMNSNNSQKNQPQNSKQQQSSQDKQQSGEKGDDKAERAEGQPQTDQNQKGEQSDKQQSESQQAPGDRPSEEAASGAGTQDGEKRAEQAKMLEAMGKMSQLLGQRSLEVSGQVMVEVGNTKQGLKTQWTQQNAGHAEAGSEIHRDEIPLMYQPFIERYFEEVRKGTQPAPAKAKPSAAAPQSGAKQKQN